MNSRNKKIEEKKRVIVMSRSTTLQRLGFSIVMPVFIIQAFVGSNVDLTKYTDLKVIGVYCVFLISVVISYMFMFKLSWYPYYSKVLN
jgi:hypothetical protein